MSSLVSRRRPGSIRILSWNVAKRRDCASQVAAALSAEPDIIVLQELNTRTWPRHRDSLTAAAFGYTTSALDLAPPRRSVDRSLASFVAVASRWPMRACRRARVPAPEAMACVTVGSPFGSFDLIGVHIPTYGRPHDRMLKVETQEGLLMRLAKLSGPTLLCGDFNAPFAEEADGTVVPFARRRGSRQYAAEARLMGATNSCGLTDLFRARHGYGVHAHSWCWKNRGRTGGYRLDHIFASGEFVVRACDYIHDWRLRGLSDHSAVYADVVLNHA